MGNSSTRVHSGTKVRNFLENEPHVREIQLTTTARNISIVSRVFQFDEEGNQRYPGDVFEVLSIVWGKDCPNQYLCILELWLFNVSTKFFLLYSCLYCSFSLPKDLNVNPPKTKSATSIEAPIALSVGMCTTKEVTI
jgi:hypothetical protein